MVPEGTAKPLAAPVEKLMTLTDGVLDEELLLLLELGGGDGEDVGGSDLGVGEGACEVEGGTHAGDEDGDSQLGIDITIGGVQEEVGAVHLEVVGLPPPPPPLPSLNHH